MNHLLSSMRPVFAQIARVRLGRSRSRSRLKVARIGGTDRGGFCSRLAHPFAYRFALIRAASQRGAATAEYLIATMAAVGFAGLLVVILKSEQVRGILTDLVQKALNAGG